MALRAEIVKRALWWADPGAYKPYPSHLQYFCKNAGCEQLPTDAEAQRSLGQNNGVIIGGKTKHWCGIFAVSVLKDCGVDARWTLSGGKMLGAGVKRIWGHANMQPGDVGVVQKVNASYTTDQHHHFIIVSVSGNVAETVEGNTAPNNMIRRSSRKLNTGNSTTSIYAFYQLL